MVDRLEGDLLRYTSHDPEVTSSRPMVTMPLHSGAYDPSAENLLGELAAGTSDPSTNKAVAPNEGM